MTAGEVTITYLEQLTRPRYAAPPRPAGKVAILRVERPTVRFYRYLYDMVGRPWRWISRRDKSDEEIAAILARPGVSLFAIYVDGEPAGMAELEADSTGITELRFFGLAPERIGMGFGRYFLVNILDIAWAAGASKIRLETCTFDHPAALPLYQKLGFVVYDQITEKIPLPHSGAQ